MEDGAKASTSDLESTAWRLWHPDSLNFAMAGPSNCPFGPGASRGRLCPTRPTLTIETSATVLMGADVFNVRGYQPGTTFQHVAGA